MDSEQTVKAGGAKQLHCRLTEHEADFIRSAARTLGMTITQYIVQKAVYEPERPMAGGRRLGGHQGSGYGDGSCLDSDCADGECLASGNSVSACRFSDCTVSNYDDISYADMQVRDYELLRKTYLELRAQGRNLNMIARSAGKIALDTRSLASKGLARSLNGLVTDLRPVILTGACAAAEAVEAMRPRRR